MAYNWDDWAFTREPDPPTGPVWWMDRRHCELIYGLLMTGRYRRVLEIGCRHGSSTSALVQAVNDGAPLDLHLCDPAESEHLRRVIAACKGKVTYHPCDSLRVLPTRQWDLVIVDGDHSLQHVSRELGMMLAQEVPTIIAHDVECRGGGCEGPVLLGDVLRMHPAYRCQVDAEKRDGEWTERGLLLASRHKV